MKRLIKIFFGFVICLAFSKAVYGASASIKVSNTNVTVNTPVTITASVSSAASWNISMSASGGSLSGSTASADVADDGISVSKQIISATFKASAEGTYTISIKGQIVDSNLNSNTVSEKVTITVKAPESTSNPTHPTDTPVTKSSNANLKNLITSPVDFTGFSASKTTGYSITVGSDVETVKVTAVTQHSKASYKVSGNTNLKEGENIISVVVTAEDGTKKTYKINVYKLSEAETVSLEEQESPDEIIAIDAQEAVEDEKLGLEKLEIEEVELNPSFNSEIYEYNLELLKDINSLNINATAYNDNLDIKIVGNENLLYGENIINIIVTNKESDKSVTYTITVNKIKNDKKDINEDVQKLQKSISTKNKIIGFLLVVIVIETIFLVKFIISKNKRRLI